MPPFREDLHIQVGGQGFYGQGGMGFGIQDINRLLEIVGFRKIPHPVRIGFEGIVSCMEKAVQLEYALANPIPDTNQLGFDHSICRVRQDAIEVLGFQRGAFMILIQHIGLEAKVLSFDKDRFVQVYIGDFPGVFAIPGKVIENTVLYVFLLCTDNLQAQ